MMSTTPAVEVIVVQIISQVVAGIVSDTEHTLRVDPTRSGMTVFVILHHIIDVEVVV